MHPIIIPKAIKEINNFVEVPEIYTMPEKIRRISNAVPKSFWIRIINSTTANAGIK
jgi:hypothetical protein